MTAEPAREFLVRLAQELARRAADRARPLIPSRTLRAALATAVLEDAAGVEALLSIPHYWAVYLHDGRSSFSARPGGFLVFFKDIRDDPRVQGGFPVRASQIRRLTKAEFRAGLERNREHFRRGGDPFDAPMIVVRSVGQAEGVRFFSEGLKGFGDVVGPFIAAEFDGYVQRNVDDGLHETDVAVLGL